MMIARDSESYRPVSSVRVFCILKRVEVQIDYIVQRPYRGLYDGAEFFLIPYIDVAKREGCEIAYYEIPRSGFVTTIGSPSSLFISMEISSIGDMFWAISVQRFEE